MKKVSLLTIAVVMLIVAGVLASCAGNQEYTANNVKIEIKTPDGDSLANGVVSLSVKGQQPTVMMAIETFLQEQEYYFSKDSYGNTITVIDEYDFADSDSEYYWTFKQNGKDPTTGMSVAPVNEGDSIVVYCKKNTGKVA